MTDPAGTPADEARSHDLYGPPGHGGELDDGEEARLVRPYALTRGRTRTASSDLPLEALVRVMPGATDPAPTPERRRILELTRESIQSVAELSAHMSLPLGVIRVLVGDLADEGLVAVHTTSSTTATPAHNLKVLESVLDGISSL